MRRVFPLKPTGRSFKRNDPLHTEKRPVPLKGTGRSPYMPSEDFFLLKYIMGKITFAGSPWPVRLRLFLYRVKEGHGLSVS